ncbi:hypothetical protein PIB30_090583 [Stylosanthes scabra]|uniref:Uncharacterized protein n=1 Tax=Stylosanthes scabra TaxID=79078 RepID=A0ABU6RVP7_9FABA|nr:hypothetical protein [Stylosanthes scabra]
MLEVVEVDVWVGGSVIFHVGWLDEVFRGLHIEDPTRERCMAVNGSFDLRYDLFPRRTRCHPSCYDDAFSLGGMRSLSSPRGRARPRSGLVSGRSPSARL